jgi:hypothetical protein
MFNFGFMKIIIRCLLMLSLFTACKTHKNALNINKQQVPNFKNTGEQENYWAQKLYENDYKKQKFETYKGDIKIIDDYHICYGQTLLELYNCNLKFKPIFTRGIFYPGILSTGDLKLSDLEEQPFLSHSVKIKRFKVWFWMPKLANPIVYFFEITNKTATQDTNLSDFIKGSKLTFVKEGWVII